MGEVFIPFSVKNEIEKYINFIPQEIRVIHLAKEDIPEVERITKIGKIHRGEAEAILLAKKINSELLLTDDTTARMYAELLSLEVHGSLGIVLWNYYNHFLDTNRTKKILESLKNSSLWISDKIFQKALSLLE
jgi:predicted nucleic acid-binding protein